MRSKILTSTLLTAITLSTLSGCSGQGNYTREGVSMAKERMSFLKSATEWEMARQAFLAGDLEKALEKVDMSLAINSSVVKSNVLRGRIMIEMGELGTAMKSLHTAEALDPEDSDAQYYLGIVFERLNRPEDAHMHFASACELDDYNPAYAVAAAEMLIDLDRVDEAKAYLSSLPLSQDNAGIRQTLGHIAMIEQDPFTAVQLFADARLLAPDDTGIIEDLVHAQMEAKLFGKAEQNIAALLKDPENADRTDLQFLHAKALLGTDRPVEARSIYQKLLSTSEGQGDVESWIGLANASYVINDDRTLRRAASRVVALAPTAPEGYTLWAMVHRKNGDNIDALSSIDNAIKRAPNDASMYAFRSLILKDLNRVGDAVASAAKAASLDPSSRQYQSMLNQFRAEAFASAPATTE